MSKSRLEKFLYAICTLDQSDLPTPLSRLEMLLYYLIINGKISDDDLTSMVGYAKIGEAVIHDTIMRDFSNSILLWEPLSRSEKYLMYILGVYDIEDLPEPKSRAEVLLYKLAVGDNDLSDIEPLQSRYEESLAAIILNGGINDDGDENDYLTYTISSGYSVLYSTLELPLKSALLKGQSILDDNDQLISCKNPILQITGKNLWEKQQNFEKHTQTLSVLTNTDDGFIIEHPSQITEFIKTFIKLKKGTWNISFNVDLGSSDITPEKAISLYLQQDKIYGNNITNMIRIGTSGRHSITYTINEDIDVACFFFDLRHTGKIVFSNFQLEEGSTQTVYEPHQSTTLTCDGNVILRSNGDVYDELDLLTGNLTRRINANNEVLSEVVTETIDISMVDQDGNDTSLSSFKNITRVIIHSEGAIPEIDIMVAVQPAETT